MEGYDVFRGLSLLGYVIPAIIAVALIVLAIVATAIILSKGVLDLYKVAGDHMRRRAGAKI